MGKLMSHVAKKVNTVLEKLDAIDANDDQENRRASAGARSVKSARSISSARGLTCKA